MIDVKRGVLVLVSILILLTLVSTAAAQPQALGIYGWVLGPLGYDATVNVSAYDQGTTNLLDSQITYSNQTVDGGYSIALTIPPGYGYVDVNVSAVNGPASGFNDSFTNVSVINENPEINITMHIPLTLYSPPNGTTSGDGTPTFVWNYTDQAFGGWYRLLVDNESGFGSPIVLNISSITQLNYTLNSSQELSSGTYYWKVQAYNATIFDESEIFELIVDSTPPTIINITPTNDTWTNNPNVTITVTTDKAGDCKFDNTSNVSFASKTYTMNDVGVTHTVNFTLIEGRNNFYFQCNDTNGNLMNISDEVYYTLKLDTIPPNATTAVVLVEGGAIYTTNNTLDFTFSGFNDSIPGIITSGIFGYHYNFTNNENTSTGVFDSSSPGQLPNAPEGTVTVYVWARDNAGNIGYAAWDDIIVDTVAPLFVPINNTAIDEDSNVNLTIFVNVTEVTSGLDGTPMIRYRYNDSSSFGVWINLTDIGGGQYTFEIPEPVASWDSNKAQNVSWQFNVSDNAGNNGLSSVYKELVDSYNDPPVLNFIANQTVLEDTLLSFNITGYDVDLDTLTYSVNLTNITLTKINDTLATVTWIPGNEYVGNHSVLFVVSDGSLNDTQVVNIEVTNANDPPALAGVSLDPNVGNNGTIVNVTSVNASDIDGDNLTMYCGDSPGNYNLCTSAPGQPELSCTFASPWGDDTNHTVYCIVNDTQASSPEQAGWFNADNTPPNIPDVLNVEGDNETKYWDTDDDNNTIIQINLSESNLACRWSSVDQSYSLMNVSNECTVVGTIASCNVAVSITSQTNLTTRYISCTDPYGNEQNSSENVDVPFGVDWTIPSVTDDNDGQIHLPGYVVNLTIHDEPDDVLVEVLHCNDATNVCDPVTSFVGTNGSTTSVTFNDRGTWYLRYNATDDAGNINETKFTIVFINNLPVISNQTYTDYLDHSFSVSANVSDLDNSQTISCLLFHSDGGAYSSKAMTLVSGINSNGTWSANLSSDEGYNVSDTIFTYVSCNDTLESVNSTASNHSMTNSLPDLDSFLVNPAMGSNGTTINITSVNASDSNSDNLTMQCGDSPGTYNLCTSAPGQPELSCTFNSPWTDDAVHTIYCVLNDTYGLSPERNSTFTSDNTPPNVSDILNVEGDDTSKYWDTDDDNNTIIQINLSESNLICRWSTTDQAYGVMNVSNECAVVGIVASCNVAVSITSQINETSRYISCSDPYGNEQNSSENTDVTFGVDWTIPSVTDDNDGQIHLPGYVVNLTIHDEPVNTTVYVLHCNDTANTCDPVTSFVGTDGSTTSLTFNDRGTWYLRYNATDDAGNINETKFTIVFINNLPVISNQTYIDYLDHSFSVSANVSDLDNSQNISCTLFHSGDGPYSSKAMTLVSGINSNGTWQANISSADGYNVSDNVSTYTECNDTLESVNTSIDSHIVANNLPALGAISLSPSNGSNGTVVNITSINASDSNSDNLTMHCGDSSGNYNLCTSSLGQPELSCTFVSPWADDTSHTIYCVINDTYGLSPERTANFGSDNTPPNSTVLNVEGDTVPKYWDTDNDNNTVIQITLYESNVECRWDTTDLTYDQMNSSNGCTVVGLIASCDVDPSIPGQFNGTTRHISCQDQYGNDQSTGANLDVFFGVDWTIPSVTDDNDGQIHQPGYVVNLTIHDEPDDVLVYVLHCNDTTNTCDPVTSFVGTNGSTTSVTFNDRGTWYLRYNATDAAGNINETKSTIIFINSLPEVSNQTYTNLPGHEFTVEANVSDIDSSQNINCTLFHSNGSSFTPKPMMLVAGINSNGTWAANISVTDGYSVFENVTTYIECNDTMESVNSSVDSNLIPNIAPSAPVVNITPDNPLYTDDLTCSITNVSIDLDSNNVTYYFQWFNGSILYLTTGPTNQTSHTLGSGNTSANDIWNCTITPFDGYVNGSSASAIANLQNFTCPVTSCNLTAPVINDTIPDYHKEFQPGNWTLDLSGYKYDVEDSGDNLTWSVKGVNPMFMEILINGDIVTFAPIDNVHGVDKVVFELTDTDGLIDTQEIRISINRSLYLFDGWNLFSVPILENRSVQYVLEPLTNGNWGCGHDDTPPFDCVAGDGDFEGNWTMLWTQDDDGNWQYFRPDVHYSLIPNQNIETIEVDQGYWIDMNLTTPINLTLHYD